MKHSTFLGKEESKKECYVYVGHQIKYDPTWVKKPLP